MLLQEEYLNRHGIAMPIVRYAKHVNVVLKNKFRWVSLQGVFEEDTRHPGKYRFTFGRPFNNIYRKDAHGPFEFLNYDDQVYWHNYEDFLVDWLQTAKKYTNDGYKALTEHKEIYLTVWEMFLYAYDGMFVDHRLTDEFYDYVYVSTNPTNAIEDRFQAYLLGMRMVENNGSTYKIYKSRFLPITQFYSTWLAELVNK